MSYVVFKCLYCVFVTLCECVFCVGPCVVQVYVSYVSGVYDMLCYVCHTGCVMVCQVCNIRCDVMCHVMFCDVRCA